MFDRKLKEELYGEFLFRDCFGDVQRTGGLIEAHNDLVDNVNKNNNEVSREFDNVLTRIASIAMDLALIKRYLGIEKKVTPPEATPGKVEYVKKTKKPTKRKVTTKKRRKK